MIVFIISNIRNSATKASRDVASNLHFLAKGNHMEITCLRHEMLMVLPKKILLSLIILQLVLISYPASYFYSHPQEPK